MTRTWCPCGAPLYPYTPDHSGCRVCYLVGLTSQQVVWDEQERQGYTAEGEAIGSVMVWSTMQEPGFDPAPFNSTDDTAATSDMLPRGCYEPYQASRIHQWDEGNDRYQRWLEWAMWWDLHHVPLTTTTS